MLRIALAAWLLVPLCQVVHAESESDTSARRRAPRFRFMSAAKEEALRAGLPKLDDENLQSVLDDPALIFYTDAEMPRAHQDWSSGLPGIHSPHYNLSANNSEPYGNGNVEFPWGTPGGTHRTTNVTKFRFLALPRDEQGDMLPVVWYRKYLSGSSATGYAWTYPVGTIFGEVLQMRGPDGKSHTFEVRFRIREYGEWAVDVFRPFPSSAELVHEIKRLRPQWEQNEQLTKFVQHLEEPRRLVKHTLSDSNHPRPAFRQSMGVDSLPALGDDALVVELLTKTTFRSALGVWWRTDDQGVSTAAPTTQESFHVVPARYDAGFIEVDRFSCMRCHDTVNRHVAEFEPGRDWYGRVRGSDGIFSFHPFDPSCISYNGQGIAVRMNDRLQAAGLLARFNGREHSAADYQRLSDPLD